MEIHENLEVIVLLTSNKDSPFNSSHEDLSAQYHSCKINKQRNGIDLKGCQIDYKHQTRGNMESDEERKKWEELFRDPVGQRIRANFYKVPLLGIKT